MRFKINPEVVRLIAMITAFVQTVGGSLALAAPDVLSPVVALVLMAIGGGLAAALAAYQQGTQTNPPEGMLTEERAAELSADTAPRAVPASDSGVWSTRMSDPSE